MLVLNLPKTVYALRSCTVRRMLGESELSYQGRPDAQHDTDVISGDAPKGPAPYSLWCQGVPSAAVKLLPKTVERPSVVSFKKDSTQRSFKLRMPRLTLARAFSMQSGHGVQAFTAKGSLGCLGSLASSQHQPQTPQILHSTR